jgi:hypothetical protein
LAGWRVSSVGGSPRKEIMKKNKSTKLFGKPLNLVIMLLVLGGALVVGAVVIRTLSGRKTERILESQIQILQGDNKITVNRSGLVEYSTPEGVFYEVWDSEKVDQFFSSMREKANAASPVQECGDGYWLTLYIDGKETTVCIVGGDEELDSLFEEFSGEGSGEDSLSELFDDSFFGGDEDEEGSQDEDLFGGLASPSPTPSEISAEEGADVPPGGGAAVPDCTLWGQQITGRTVISNTICLVEGD